MINRSSYLLGHCPAANLLDGHYIYLRDLLALDACRPLAPVSPASSAFISPLPLHAWCKYLELYPDRDFTLYLLNGVSLSFRIGFDRTTHILKCSRRNMSSARQNPAIIEDYIAAEVRLGRLVPLSPLATTPSQVHTSPFGLIPKKGCPNCWKLIVDLSSPPGFSVNDGIDSSLTSLHYLSLDDAVAIIQHLGPGTLMAKLDLKSAYRLVPVHPDDRILLGTSWKDSIYLPPKYFLQWLTSCCGSCTQKVSAGSSTTWTTLFYSVAHPQTSVFTLYR